MCNTFHLGNQGGAVMTFTDAQNGTVIDFRPPYDRIADLENTYLEESVLAGIIDDASASSDTALGISYVAGLLPSPAAFRHRSHRLIYACMLALHESGLKPNLQAVALRLARDGLLAEVGGRNKLAQLLDRDAFATLHLKQNAELLREAYQRRMLAAGLSGINLEKDLDTALDQAHEEIERLLLMRSTNEKLSNRSMRSLIVSILERNLGEAEQREALNKLAKDSGWNPKECRELVEIVESALDAEESRSERTQEIEQLEEYKGRTLTLSKYLPSSYANPMQKVAEWLGVPSAALLLEILVGAASCAHPETRIVVKESIGFIEPLIIYGGLVTESGQRKSPTVNAVFDAIKQLQAEEEERFRLDSQEYELEQKEWADNCPGKDSPDFRAWQDEQPTPPPPLRELYLDIATVEAIDKLKGQQPDTAFVLLKDELSGLFGSYGAYKNGKGEDREAILSGWNGRGRKKNLKGGERVSTLYDAMSIFGAIQDSKLQQMMGSFDDDQGDWGRFLWALIPLKALRLPESDTTFQLAFLKSLFERVRSLSPQKYRFAFDAQRLYEDFHWKLEQRRVAHPQRGMRAAIAKMEGYCARLALALHLIWEVEAGQGSAPYIPKERVQQAIRLTEFFFSQVTLIHSEGAAALGEGGLTPRLSAILGKLKQFGEITARKLQASVSWLRKVTPDKLRQDLIELAKLGYGTIQGKGNRLKLVCDQTADTADRSADKTADTEDSLKPLNLREFQELNQLTADTADIDSIDSSSSIGSSNQGDSNHSNLNQQYQQISSPHLNQDSSSLSLADIKSAGISADGSTSAHNPNDDPPPDDSDNCRQHDGGTVPPAIIFDEPASHAGMDDNGDASDSGSPLGSPVTPAYSPSVRGESTLSPEHSSQGDGGWGFEVIAESVIANAAATEPAGNVGGVPLTTLEIAQWHDRMNACQTLDDATDFYMALETLPLLQRNQFESSVSDKRWTWLFNLPEVLELKSSEPEPVSEVKHPEFLDLLVASEQGEVEPEPQSTLEELKAMLLACNTLTALNQIKRMHKKTIGKAYRSMTEKEQSQIDAIAALAVPQKVYKYVGDEIRQGTERLMPGTLVYLDPHTPVRASDQSAPVWALNGMANGWTRPIDVSFSMLKEIAKAFLPSNNSEQQQMGLL